MRASVASSHSRSQHSRCLVLSIIGKWSACCSGIVFFLFFFFDFEHLWPLSPVIIAPSTSFSPRFRTVNLSVSYLTSLPELRYSAIILTFVDMAQFGIFPG